MRSVLLVLLATVAPACALQLGIATTRRAARCSAPRAGEGDELGGAISSTFGEIFGSMFKPDAEKQAAIDRAYAEQLEVAKARKDPKNSAENLRRTEERRRKSSEAFEEKFDCFAMLPLPARPRVVASRTLALTLTLTLALTLTLTLTLLYP